ncbi:MAG: DUF4870 domain-containing protein [Phycisphaerales bacterium]
MSQNPSQTPFPSAVDPDVCSYATYTHLVPLIAHLGTPFIAPLIAAIIMWQIKKDQSPFLNDHGREATNFQISLVIYAVAVGILGVITCGFGWILSIPLIVLNIVGCVLAAKAAHRGEYYRYPMSIRVV